MSVQFEDFRIQVENALDEAGIAFLYEAAGEVESQTKQNSRVGKTGQTKNAWTYVVDEGKREATVGNPLENAIWEEFGTGEFALKGDGRKGGWYYQDEEDGTWHHTYGKTPHRAFQSAFNILKNPLIRRAQEIFKERLGR